MTRPTWSHAARCDTWSTRHRWHQRRSKRNGCCDLELTDLQLTCPWTQSRVPISSHLVAALNRLLMVTTMCEVSTSPRVRQRDEHNWLLLGSAGE